MHSTLATAIPTFQKAPVSAGKQVSCSPGRLIAAHKYVSPRYRPITPEEAEIRRIAYALKVPTPEALQLAARDLAPLLDAAEDPDTRIVLMPVPTSTGSVEPNRRLARAVLSEIRRRYPSRGIRIKITVGRQHPVESSCARRRRGAPGLRPDEHAFIRIAGPLDALGTAYYFIDNVATTGTTLAACRAALHFGDAIVYADSQHTH